MYLLTFLICCCLLHSSTITGEDKVLYLMGLYSLGGAWPGGPGTRMATEMALEIINKQEDLLPGYRLEVIWKDTQCVIGQGVNTMYEQLYTPPTKIMILGAACSPVSEATAVTSKFWNIIELSYVSSSPSLSDTSRFPLFFRLSSPQLIVNPASIALMKKNNWNRVATLHQTIDIFSKVTDDLALKLRENNMTLVTSEIFTDDPTQQVINLKRHDVRIIFTGLFEDKAYKLFCEIYKQGLYGSKYVWVVTGFYDEEWWLRENDHSECTVEQISTAVEGVIGMPHIYLNPKPVRDISGFTPNGWMEYYLERMKGLSQYALDFGPLAYDTAWAAALALNHTQQILKDWGSNTSLEDFTYEDKDINRAIYESMFKVEFQGLKGFVKFDEFGDNAASVMLRRIQGGVRQVVGILPQGSSEIEWSTETPIVWADGYPPPDATTQEEKWIYVDQTTYIIMSLLAGMGVTISIGFSIFNIVFRKERLIKMSSPKMNNVIVVGCVIAYITVFLQERSDEEVLLLCKVRTYTLMIGFSMAFGALFAKTWRVYAIFMNQTKKVVIKDSQLFIMVAAIVGIDVVILVTREIMDPLVADRTVIDTIEINGGDLVITNLVWVCTSQYDVYFKGAIYTIKGLLLIFGAFLAWQTRTVKIPALNDSQYIGVCIYNVAVLSLLGVVLAFALTDQVIISYIFTCSLIIFGTTITQMIIFIPKITKFRSAAKQVEEDSTASVASAVPTMQTTVEQTKTGGGGGGGGEGAGGGMLELRTELQKKTKLLQEAEAQISSLKAENESLKMKLQGP